MNPKANASVHEPQIRSFRGIGISSPYLPGTKSQLMRTGLSARGNITKTPLRQTFLAST
jgi:hypothetical protein